MDSFEGRGSDWSVRGFGNLPKVKGSVVSTTLSPRLGSSITLYWRTLVPLNPGFRL